ncbi:MAG: carboxypeptidase regulatory-like domain-containing protein [Saprospiraceae bacterium]|nr:carboxypeptidase regulatory-like domain-containing protein [Saprospiraceae bacterium]
MKNKLLPSLLGLGLAISLSAQTSLSGKITDLDSGEPILFCNVKIYQNQIYKTGVQSDFDGNYSFSPLAPGQYDIEVSYVGYMQTRVEGVVVEPDKENRCNVALEAGINLEKAVIIEYAMLFESGGYSEEVLPVNEQGLKRPSTIINNNDTILNVGCGSSDDGEDVTIKGTRANATIYYYDFIRINGNPIGPVRIYQVEGSGEKTGTATLVVDKQVQEVVIKSPEGKRIKKWGKLDAGEYLLKGKFKNPGNYMVVYLLDGTNKEFYFFVPEKAAMNE